MLKKRVEVLFDPQEYRRLEERARVEGRSVGSLIREAVEKYCIEPTLEERRKAAQWIVSQEMDVGTWEEMKEGISRSVDEQLRKGLEAN